MSDGKYIRVFFISLIVIMVIIGLSNYLIDPYGLHYNNRYEGFNKHKPGFLKYTRTAKLYNADEICPEALFLGNSRLLYLAPEEAFARYKDLTCYNFALSSGRLNEMCELLAYSIRNYNIEYVCYGIDYISMCSHNGKYGAGFDRKLVSGQKSKFLEYLKLLTSVQAVEESFNCLRTNINDPEGESVIYHYNRYGSRTNKWRHIMLEKQGEAWIDNKIASSLQMYKNIYNDTSLYLPYSNTYAYKVILQQCRDNDIEFSAFVSPLYKDHFELLISSAIYPDYINFLTFLAKNGGFWYFGGINEITSDKNYFWDSQHPRNALGGIIAQIMLSDEPNPIRNKLFGTFYTRENIGELIAELDLLRIELKDSE